MEQAKQANETPAWTLSRNAMGKLVWTGADGVAQVGVVPVRAFPLGAPDDGLSLVSPDGHELVWIDRLDAMPEPARTLIGNELATREFVPVIERLIGVSTFSTPSTWTVETDRGATTFVLKAEEDIRRLSNGALLIASAHGIA
ncbi:MAG: hypothetical protein RJA44_1219, partial [Pseudomonadota bacterium]